MNVVRRVAAVAAVLMTGSMLIPGSASAAPAPPGPERMDAAVRLASGVDRTKAGAKGRVLPLTSDGRGRVEVYVTGSDVAAAREAVRAAGGEVSDQDGSRVRAAVPPANLRDLAGRTGVVEVRRPEAAVPLEITSEGVGPSGAQAWHSAGRQGAGAKVGILDVGFGRLAAAQAAGEVPAGVSVDNGRCDPDVQSSHGTTMAEIVHDMAPAAQLFLACVTDAMSFDDAARGLAAQGVQVVNVSMGFPGTGRGNGTVDAGAGDWSPATVVAWLRGQGIVVVAAAGNEAEQHANATAVDSDGNGWLNLPGGSENQGFSVRESGAPITIELRWDAWPRTNTDYDVYVMDQLGLPSEHPEHTPVAVSTRPQQETPGGLDPVELVTIQNTQAGSAYWIYLKVKNGAPLGTRLDLTIHGRAQGVSIHDPAGSIAEPASSPYAIAVGAITPAGAAAGGDVEPYSGRGPTIDGRVKPDVTGFTGVSTFTGGAARPDQGTSVAAAHVAGAAALYKSTRPALEPAELEALLLDSSTRPGRDNAFGAGVLNAGPIGDLAPPAGSAFTPLPTYRRLIDTRDPDSRHPAPLAAGETVTLPVPDLPADATAVMMDLAAVAPSIDTRLEVFPDTPSGVLAVGAARGRISTGLVTATLHPQTKTIRVRNASGSTHVVIDVVGWYSRDSSASTFVPKTSPYRLMDTRTWSIPSPRLDPGEEQVLRVRGVAGVPDTATAVLVDVTGTDVTQATNLEVFSRTARGKVTLSAGRGETRQTLALAAIADDGTIRVRNGSGQAHAVVDLVGWYATGGAGARYVPLRYAQPIFDSRLGNQGPPLAFGSADTRPFQVEKQPRVPSTATAVVLGVTQTSRNLAEPTSASLWCAECGWSGHTNVSSTASDASDLPPPGGGVPISVTRTLAGLAVVPLGVSGALNVRNAVGDGSGNIAVEGVHIVAGLTGYFVGGGSDGSSALPAPAGHWKLDEGSGLTAADSSGNGRPATLQGGVTWAGGHTGQGITLNGTSGHATTASSVLHTDRSFTVAAWVRLTRRGNYFTAVAQAGQQQSAFYLQYAPGIDTWRFVVPSGDTANPASYASADAPGQAALNEWTHLTGVYDATTHELRLYVNGRFVGRGTATLWDATGAFTIGAARAAGSTANFFPGSMDDVRAYDRALAESEVRLLAGA